MPPAAICQQPGRRTCSASISSRMMCSTRRTMLPITSSAWAVGMSLVGCAGAATPCQAERASLPSTSGCDPALRCCQSQSGCHTPQWAHRNSSAANAQLQAPLRPQHAAHTHQWAWLPGSLDATTVSHSMRAEETQQEGQTGLPMGLAAWMCRPTRFTSPSISSGVLRREEVMSLQYGGWWGRQQRETLSSMQQEPGHQHGW